MKNTYNQEREVKGGGRKMNNKSRLKKIITMTALALGISGLGYGTNYTANKLRSVIAGENPSSIREGTYEGYKVIIGNDAGGRRMCINDGESHLSARDYNKDGRFDEIILDQVPEGHSLERFANLSELDRAYESVNSQK